MIDGPESSGSGDRVSLSALFIGFLKVSLCGFGGGLVWARRVVVEECQWMDEQEFAEPLTLCQLMPGSNIVGITVRVGAKRTACRASVPLQSALDSNGRRGIGRARTSLGRAPLVKA